MLSLHPVCVTLLSPVRLVMPHGRGHSPSLPDAGLHVLTLLVSRVCRALVAQGKTPCPVESLGESGAPTTPVLALGRALFQRLAETW